MQSSTHLDELLLRLVLVLLVSVWVPLQRLREQISVKRTRALVTAHQFLVCHPNLVLCGIVGDVEDGVVVDFGYSYRHYRRK